MGALRALGVTFFDDQFDEVESLGGGALNSIRHCDPTGVRWLVKETKLRVLTDVNNPLLGSNGAAAIFGPQKCASDEQVKALDDALRNYADVLDAASETHLRDTPGAGAAGGTAFGLAACLGAEITSGFDWIASITELDSKIAQCDFAITGEGRFDHQSLSGKVIGELVKLCKKYGKPLYVVAGSSAFDSAPPDVAGVVVPISATGQCTSDEIAAATSTLDIF
jgi:glycerate kinase